MIKNLGIPVQIIDILKINLVADVKHNFHITSIIK